MPTRDGSDPNHPLPLFLSGHADEFEQWGTSRILKASILVIAVMVSGIAIALSLGNPVEVFADATASLTDNSAAQRAPLNRRRQFNQPLVFSRFNRPLTFRFPRQLQGGRQPAKKLLPSANQPIRLRLSHHLEPCLGNSKLGQQKKMHGHTSL